MLTEQNLISILLLGLVLVMAAFSFIFDKLKKAYREHLKLNEDEIKELQHSFDSLLFAKKKQHKELKELKASQVNLANKNMVKRFEYDNVVSSLENCRLILELNGRVGTVQHDFYVAWCVKSYNVIVSNLIKATSVKISELISKQSQDQTGEKANLKRNEILVEKMRITLKNISFKILNKTEIIQELVDEMFHMTDDFCKRREQYFLSSGPVPRAHLSQDILKGVSFKGILRKILEEENLDEAQLKVVEYHISSILMGPLLGLHNAINDNSLDKMLSDTGFLVLDVDDRKIGISVSFTIPAFSRKNLNESSKDFTKTHFANLI